MNATGETKQTGYGEAVIYETTEAKPKLEDHGPGLTRLVIEIDKELSGLAWIYGPNWESMVSLHEGTATFSSICGGIQDS